MLSLLFVSFKRMVLTRSGEIFLPKGVLADPPGVITIFVSFHYSRTTVCRNHMNYFFFGKSILHFILFSLRPGQRASRFLIPLFIILLLFPILPVGCNSKIEHPPVVIAVINPSKGLVGVVDGFKEGMKQRGYLEGRNVTYLDQGPLEDDMSRVDAAIRQAVQQKVDLILTMTTPVTRRVKAAVAGTGIPVVFAPVFSPQESGIVEALTHPGGNLTGVKVRGSAMKALEWLKKIVPRAKRIFIPFHYTDDAASKTVEDLGVAAKKLEMELITVKVSDLSSLTKALESIPTDTDAVWLTCSHLIFSNIDKIVSASEARKLPVASSTGHQKRGVLLSYGEDEYQEGLQASRLADRILHGVSPTELPVETADYFLGINLESARKLDIKIPNDIVLQADYVVR
jgi:putative ABC transport system substrate-binding protein